MKKQNTQKSNAGKMAALANQVKQLQAQADAGKLKASRVKKQNPNKEFRSKAAAQFTDAARRVGMKDLVAHTVSWVTGFVVVGNGVLGENDNVYFACTGTPGQLVKGAGGFHVPILAADENLGAAYVADLDRHYARKIIRKMCLRLVSIIPSTANSCMVAVAPIRGSAGGGDSGISAGLGVGANLANTLGMQGAKSLASYESVSIDMTPYIAGGFGARQNEFNINADGESPTFWGGGAIDILGLAPGCFTISGLNSTVALRGLTTHYVIVEQTVDYLDFLAGIVNVNPSNALKVSREDALFLLKIIMTSGQKNPTDLELTKSLVKFVGKDSF